MLRTVHTAPSAVAITRPIFLEKFHLEVVPDEGVFLISENQSFVLEGAILQAVSPLINGQRTSEEIVSLLAPRVEAGDARAALSFLAEHGYIREVDPMMPPQFAAFWTELGVDTRRLPALFAETPVQIVSLSTGNHAALAGMVQAFGLNLSATGKVLLVVTDDYLDPRLEDINRRCLAAGTPWMLFKPDGVNIWIGPIIVPGRTACWACLASRLADNREVESFIRERRNRSEPLPKTRARLWTSSQQAYSMAVTQLVRWLATGANPTLESHVVIAETVAFAFSQHPVVRRPQCKACGDPRLTERQNSPLVFQHRNKHHNADGGERHEAPEVTFAKYQHHISPISGIVRGLHASPWNAISPIRTYSAGHNFALKNGSLLFLKDGLRTLSSGKGRTDAQARTSALCEALERYSGVFRGEELRRPSSLRALGEQGIHPNSAMLFSERQYRERDLWLRRQSRFQVVPKLFDEDAVIDWSPVYSYTEKRIKYLPTSYLYYGYPHDDERFYCWADSNGNASGTTLEDACLQAFYELVERDGVCVWWYNQVRRPRVDLDSFGDPYYAELQEFYAGVAREFWLLDLTTDLDIPVFAAVNRRLNAPAEDIIMGFGAHMDPRIAASRAITEMNQFIPSVLNAAPDGTTLYGIDDKDALNWWRGATILNQPYLTPLHGYDRRLGDFQTPPQGAILDRLTACFAAVERSGLEVLLLDQTRPDIGLSVVKVLVPGLRHFWARFAPGRLYDVPVRLGWLKTPTPEEHLNPIPMFL